MSWFKRPTAAPSAPQPLPEAEWGAAVKSDKYFGGARLLASDFEVACVMLNDGRARAIQGVFGVPQGDMSWLVTVMALGVVAKGIQGTAAKVKYVPPLTDALLGGALLRESVHTVAGDWSRESPLFGTLVTMSLLAAVVGPGIRGSAHAVRSASHTMRTDFDHRYGHLVRRNHPRRLLARARGGVSQA